MAAPAIVLASASPRRRELLAAAGVDFEVVVPAVDETLRSGTTAEDGARLLAERKARAVLARFHGTERWIVAADTIVAVDLEGEERLLGKPENEFQARQMLRWLSGTRHRVVTGVAVARARDGALESGFERTFVHMRAITPAEVEAYVASEEWRDKAGGYAIQETADRFVTRLEEGGFDNVVGLPVAKTLELLARLAAPCAPR
ncbi:MAG: Maf family protein [Planctomycetota bacterium]